MADILVLGGEGMLGHKMFQTLRDSHAGVVCTLQGDPTHPPLGSVDLLHGADVLPGVDATDWPGLASLLGDLSPQFVINCIGIVKQRPAAMDHILCIEINSLLPHRLAHLAQEWGGRLIHFSTDCVFRGTRGPYSEDDPSDALDLYGRSKHLGEVTTGNALTLRTSIIGRELVNRRSLLEWFLGQTSSSVKGYRRAIYSGVTTNELSRIVSWLISGYPALSGLYQVASSPISKYELLLLIRDAFRCDTTVIPDDETEPFDRSLNGARFREATGYVASPWPELVRALADDPTPYDRWRAQCED